MAIGNMLAGVGGFFDGWKSMDELIKSHQQMLATQEKIEGYQTGKALADQEARDLEDYRRTTGQDSYGGEAGGNPDATTGSSTPPGTSTVAASQVPELQTSGRSLSTSDVYKLVTDAGFKGNAADKMTAIIRAESSNDPGAIGDKSIGGSYGLTQINKKAHGDVALEALNNPPRAVELAYQISKQGTDFTPWTMYKNGVYKRYMVPPPDLEGQRVGIAPAAASSALGTDSDLMGGTTRPAATNTITVPPPTPSGVSTAPGPTVAPPPSALGPAPVGQLVMDPSVPRTAQGRAAAAPMSQTSADYAAAVSQGFKGTIQDFANRKAASQGGSGGGTPQMPGSGAGGNNPYNTQLQPTQEAAFRAWVKNNKVKFNPDADMTDYDMRGFWNAMQQGDPRAQTSLNPDLNEVHYPDFWKTPIHKTFSNESQYAPPGAPRWSDGQLISNDGNVLVDERANALGR